MRVGLGFDVHELVDNRPLMMGGVPIPFKKGLRGHSDADVLLHAIMDALLGAMALGDIGTHFPDTDPKYKGADSMLLLEHVYQTVVAHQYHVVNLDCTIMAQQPKMNPHLPSMRQKIADCLQVSVNCVSIKATTTEHLGFIGREEGIAAQAIVLLLAQTSP